MHSLKITFISQETEVSIGNRFFLIKKYLSDLSDRFYCIPVHIVPVSLCESICIISLRAGNEFCVGVSNSLKK